MNRRQENDPERDRNSRNTGTDEIGRDNLTRNPDDQSDLGRAQSEGNLGNERTRSGPRDSDSSDRDRSRDDRSL